MIALIKYQVKLLGSTDLTPVDSSFTTSGKICSISCAITPNWVPCLSTTAAFEFLKSVISSSALYSKFLTCIWLILFKPTLLSTMFFLILLSDVVDQDDELFPWNIPPPFGLMKPVLVPFPVAPVPIIISKAESEAAVSKFWPSNTLPRPVVKLPLPLQKPIIVLHPPVVMSSPAKEPIKVFLIAVVILSPACTPIATLQAPVVEATKEK